MKEFKKVAILIFVFLTFTFVAINSINQLRTFVISTNMPFNALIRDSVYLFMYSSFITFAIAFGLTIFLIVLALKRSDD